MRQGANRLCPKTSRGRLVSVLERRFTDVLDNSNLVKAVGVFLLLTNHGISCVLVKSRQVY